MKNGHDKVPVSVRVMGKRWVIEYREQDEYGLCDYKQTKITISEDQSLENMRDTVLHELVHAISNEVKAGLNEKQTATISTGVLAILRDNPGLVRFLTD